MTTTLERFWLLTFSCFLGCAVAVAQKPRPAGGGKQGAAPRAAPLGDEEVKARLDAALKLAPEESVRELESLVKNNPRSPHKARAQELLTAARAALGDERLRAGDAEGGIKLFRQAVAQAPAEIPDKLFVEVVSQLPANLFLRGHAEAAMQLARAVEERVKSNPQRLLAVAAFYLSVEQPEEAARVAQASAALAPELAAAHVALGAAHRIALRLDEAAKSYRRAVELDPRSAPARRALADLLRAAGKPEEALALYRELLAAEPKDASARAGSVLSLFDADRREEAERELEAALNDDPRNLPLLVGAAWWYVSRSNNAARAQELAARAVELEARYTWAQVALARALVAQKRPLEAEGALRFARRHGRFPTLDYELANALASAGFYEEAAEELARSFNLKDGQIETMLARRVAARAQSFTELLAPERRASIFQSASPDTDANAAMLKGLLALHLSLKDASAKGAGEAVAGVADAFVNGDDEMRAFRQLYAASRLLKRGGSPEEARKLVEAATARVDASLDAPNAASALLADDLRDLRARAIGEGSLPAPPQLPRNTLSNVMRGRIEDLAGWSLFLEGKHAEASVRLRRAVSVLPENSPWWRDALWHLGAALDGGGDGQAALAAYFRAYDRRSPDPARRAIIEGVYKRVNGTLEGFEEKLNSPPSAVALLRATTPPAGAATPTEAAAPPLTPTPSPSEPAPSPVVAPTPTAQTIPEVPSPAPQPSPEAKKDEPTTTPAGKRIEPEPTREKVTPEPTPAMTFSPIPPTPRAEATPAPEPTPAATPQAAPTPANETSEAAPTPERAEDAANAQPTPAASPEPTPADTTAQPTPTTESKPARVRGSHRAGASSSSGPSSTPCTLSVSQESLTLERGGSAVLTLNFNEQTDPAPTVNAATPNWSDILLFAEPRAAADGNVHRYTVTSVGKKPGLFTINFTSPCGDKTVTVTVK